MFLLHVKSFLITHSHPQRAKEDAKKKSANSLAFILAGAEKQATFFARRSWKVTTHTSCHCVRIVLVTVTVSLLWQAQCLVIYMFIMFYIHPSLSRTLPQSAWHIPLWCAFNCSKILKQFLFLHLQLLLLLRSCQRICHKFILIFDSKQIERQRQPAYVWHVYY